MMSYTTNGSGRRGEMEAVLTDGSAAPVTSQPSATPAENTQLVSSQFVYFKWKPCDINDRFLLDPSDRKTGDGGAVAQENNSGTAHERAFFHIILLLV